MEVEQNVPQVVPDNPTELSFWVAQNVPMLEDHRMKVLKINSPIQRLRFELEAMQQVCVRLKALINLSVAYCVCSEDDYCMSQDIKALNRAQK